MLIFPFSITETKKTKLVMLTEMEIESVNVISMTYLFISAIK